MGQDPFLWSLRFSLSVFFSFSDSPIRRLLQITPVPYSGFSDLQPRSVHGWLISGPR